MLLRIYDGRQAFWQWDADQQVIVDCATACYVHFKNPDDTTTYTVEVTTSGELRVADVPNILLQTAGTINAWIYRTEGSSATIDQTDFFVQARQRPSTYIYTQTEVLDYSTLAARIATKITTPDGGETGNVLKKTATGVEWGTGGGSGASSWSDLSDKPFTTVGDGLKVVSGALQVDTATAVQQDNTKPITSGAVYTEIGGINNLLSTI